MCETHSVIPPIRFIVKSKFRIAPVKFTRIDYDSSDSGSMPADPFGEGMHHDVRPVFNRAQERRRGESGIDDQRQMVFFRNRRIPFDVRGIQRGIADRFNVERPRSFINGLFHRLKVIDCGKMRCDPLLRKNCIELRKSPSVKIIRGNQFIPLPQNICNCKINCGGSAPECNRRPTAFQRCKTFFQHIIGRVHQSGIDVSMFPVGEKVCAVSGVFETVGGGAVNGDRARLRCRIRDLPCVKRQCLNMIFRIIHRLSSFYVVMIEKAMWKDNVHRNRAEEPRSAFRSIPAAGSK